MFDVFVVSVIFSLFWIDIENEHVTILMNMRSMCFITYEKNRPKYCITVIRNFMFMSVKLWFTKMQILMYNVFQIHVRFLRHRHLYIRSMSFLKFSNLWPFFTFSNQLPMMSLRYTLTLANTSAIDLRIWKGRWFENTLKLNRDLR